MYVCMYVCMYILPIFQYQDMEADMDAVWQHPIDSHYSVSSVQGWPKLGVEVWYEDQHGTLQLGKYDVIYCAVCSTRSSQAIPHRI
jgi:hypothetical protein